MCMVLIRIIQLNLISRFYKVNLNLPGNLLYFQQQEQYQVKCCKASILTLCPNYLSKLRSLLTDGWLNLQYKYLNSGFIRQEELPLNLLIMYIRNWFCYNQNIQLNRQITGYFFIVKISISLTLLQYSFSLSISAKYSRNGVSILMMWNSTLLASV